jgi:hypothetical protein
MSNIVIKIEKLIACCILMIPMVHAKDPNPVVPTRPVGSPEPADSAGFVPQYAVKWREFIFIDASAPWVDYEGIADIDWALSGSQLYLAHDRTYAVTGWSERQAGFPASAIHSQPLPPLPAGPYYTALKYRYGSFYMKRGGTIYRYEPSHRRWMVHFSGPSLFRVGNRRYRVA